VRPAARAVVRRPGRVSVRAVASESELSRRRLTGLGVARSRVAAIQRVRILAATVRAIDELGYADTSVAGIVARSQVSRRTFYELFANREECLVAVLDDAVARVALELERADLARFAWRERLRAGLWAILSFLDREPVLARVCVVHGLGGGAAVRAQRERTLSGLAAVVDAGRFEGGRGGECTRLMSEGLVGAAYMILYTRLAEGGEPVSGLLGELLGLILLPYLGPAAARREQARPAPSAPIFEDAGERSPSASAADPLQGVAMRLTYRTARVLEAAGEHPGASNRQVADLAGIGDPGQVSKLLRRLERLGLLKNRGGGHAQGEPNEWSLTAKGQIVTGHIRMHAPRQPETA
jgi:AcrR family transcriptional regulator